MSKLYLYSQNWEDWKLVSSATAELGWVARKPIGFSDVRELLESVERHLFFVDGDDPRVRSGFEEAASQAGAAKDAGNRVYYCVSPEKLKGFFENGPAFGGAFVVRRPGADAGPGGRVLAGFLRDLEAGGEIPSAATERQAMTLTHTRDRAKALEAVSSLLSGFRCDPRVSAAIETTVDELIANAIFDAPVDEQGRQLYGGTARSTEMELRGRQEVRLSFGHCGNRLYFTVKDGFGSLDRGAALRHITRDFKGKEYIPDDARANAGLGLATGFATGASYLLTCEPGVRTEVTAFFGMESGYRAFLDQFQFVSARIVGRE